VIGQNREGEVGIEKGERRGGWRAKDTKRWEGEEEQEEKEAK